MRIAVLSYYYPPDLGPGALRAQSIALSLLDILSKRYSDYEIDIITTTPRRYRNYIPDSLHDKSLQNVRIFRIDTSGGHGGIFFQFISFLSFGLKSYIVAKNNRYDVVVATTSRLATGTLGALIARRTGGRLYLDIRDLLSDTASRMFTPYFWRLLGPLVKFVEHSTLKYASAVNIISPGFSEHVAPLIPNTPIDCFTNGIDPEFIMLDKARSGSRSICRILYAGNIGYGQGLHRVVPQAMAAVGSGVVFYIYGDGGARDTLEAEISSRCLNNVIVKNPIPRKKLLSEYEEADILFLHLNDNDAFTRVLPSKIFEYAATGLPILAGVSGLAADFLRREVEGVYIFQPCEPDGLVGAISLALSGPQFFSRSEFCEKYDRGTIMALMVDSILRCSEV